MDDKNTIVEETSFLDYLLPLAKWRWVVFCCCLLGGVAGIIVALITPPAFTATTYFMPRGAMGESNELATLVGSTGKNWQEVRSDSDIIKYYEVTLKTRAMMERLLDRQFDSASKERASLAEIMGIEPSGPVPARERAIQALRKKIELSPGGGKMVALSYTCGEPRLSADVANAVLEEFEKMPKLSKRTSDTVDLIKERMNTVRTKLDELANQLSAEKDRTLDMSFNSADSAQRIAKLERESGMQNELLHNLSAEYAKAEIRLIQAQKESMQEIDIIDMASPPLLKSNASRRKIATTFGLAGALVGVMLAIVLDYLQKARTQLAEHPFWEVFRKSKRQIVAMGVSAVIIGGLAAGYYLFF